MIFAIFTMKYHVAFCNYHVAFCFWYSMRLAFIYGRIPHPSIVHLNSYFNVVVSYKKKEKKFTMKYKMCRLFLFFIHLEQDILTGYYFSKALYKDFNGNIDYPLDSPSRWFIHLKFSPLKAINSCFVVLIYSWTVH